MCCKKIINNRKRMISIIIICVNYCKRTIYFISRAKHCMSSSPRFFSPIWNLIIFRNVRKFLKCIGNIHKFAYSVSDHFFKFFFIVFFYNEYNLFKSCSSRVIDRKIYNDVPFPIYRINLF